MVAACREFRRRGMPHKDEFTLLFGALLGTEAPAGALLVFLRCWVLLYGAVSMEVRSR